MLRSEEYYRNLSGRNLKAADVGISPHHPSLTVEAFTQEYRVARRPPHDCLVAKRLTTAYLRCWSGLATLNVPNKTHKAHACQSGNNLHGGTRSARASSQNQSQRSECASASGGILIQCMTESSVNGNGTYRPPHNMSDFLFSSWPTSCMVRLGR